MPIDLKEININLASSDKRAVRVAGMVVRAIRRMPVEFLPDYLANKDKYNYLLKEEDGEALKRRNMREQK
ncbi:hypothetical protein KKD37_04150 [Patescibacteria group bacterium]|nr:hypothetical protein [Patescibacteria group bacterium]